MGVIREAIFSDLHGRVFFGLSCVFSLIGHVCSTGRYTRMCYRGIHFIDNFSSVTLEPSGYVPVCLNGEITLTCSTSQGTLLWESDTINQFFNMLQPPVTKDNFNLSVTSVDQQVVGGMTFPSVTSTATMSNFQSEQNGTSLSCVETTTTLRMMAIFIEAGEILNMIL